MRDDFQVREAVSIDEAVRMADEAPSGVVVLSDTGDTVFGGSAGDSNLILESMLRQGIAEHRSGPDDRARNCRRLDGRRRRRDRQPPGGRIGRHRVLQRRSTVTGTVRKIGDGMIKLDDNHQHEIDMGRTVVFDVGPVTMLISEMRGVAGNLPGVYEAFGIEPADYKIAVLKTASNFQYFAPITSQVIRVDTRGPGQSDIATLPWKRIPRPVYPLDPIAD